MSELERRIEETRKELGAAWREHKQAVEQSDKQAVKKAQEKIRAAEKRSKK